MSSCRKRPRRGSKVVWLALLAALSAACAGEYPQTTFRPVTEFGELIDGLFNHVFLLTLFVLVLVETILIYVLVRYRRREGAPPPKHVHGHTGLEIAWTLGPAIIVALIAVPSVRGIFATQGEDVEGALQVDVIGHQWWWEFRYPELGITTANELHVPVGRPIRLRMRSADVIHSFWIPRIGGKRDVNPQPRLREGEQEQYNYLTFTIAEPGSYLGQCAEYCGTQHAVMRMRAVAHSPEDFEAWVQAMKTPVTPAPGSLEERGQQIFTSRSCIACHTIEGTTAMGTIGPNLTRVGARWAIGAGAVPNTRENLIRWIKAPHEVKKGVLMPGATVGAAGMPPTGLSDEEIEAVAAYLASLK